MTLRDPVSETRSIGRPSLLVLASAFSVCLAIRAVAAPNPGTHRPVVLAQAAPRGQGTPAQQATADERQAGAKEGEGAAGRSGLDRNLERAREAFIDGRALMKEERWPAAAMAFERAAEVRRTPGLLYHIAYCHEQSGQLARARQNYAAARALLQEQAAPDVEKLLPEALARVESQLGQLLLTGAPPSARLSIDGAEVTPAGEHWLEPGEHEVHLTANGYEPRRFVLRLARGQAEKVDLSLHHSGTSHAAQTSTSAREGAVETSNTNANGTKGTSPAREIMFWGGLSFAAAGTALGIIGVVQVQDASTRANAASEAIDAATPGQDGDGSHCRMPSGELADLCSQLTEANAAREDARNLAIVGFSVAAVGVTTAVLSRTLWKGKSTEVGVTGLPGGGVLHLSGRF